MRSLRLSPRELLIAALAVVTTLGAVYLSGPDDPLLPSGVYDWEEMEVVTTRVGARRSLVRARTGTLDELEMHVTTLNPGETSHAPHRHANEEILIVKEGFVEEYIEGKRYRLGPGSVIFIAPNDEHNIRNVGDVQATYHVIAWKTPATGQE